VRQVNANCEFHAERVGDRYYVLSQHDIPVCSEIGGEMLELVSHQWKEFTTTIVNDVVEGLVFNINFREYKVNKIMSFTYKIDGKYAMDSTLKHQLTLTMRMENGVCWDLALDTDMSETINRERFVVVGVTNLGHLVYRICQRNDRVYPDSYQQMEVARAKSVKFDDLLKFHVVEAGIGNSLDLLELSFRECVDVKDVPQELFPSLLGKRLVRDDDVTYIGPDRLLKAIYPKHALVDDMRVGYAFKDKLQERNYYQNVKKKMIVVNMIKPSSKIKEYVSWGDCFLAFRGNMFKYMSDRFGDSVVISKEFDQYEFQRFCLRHGLFLKDGICFSSVLLWQESFKGFNVNDHVLVFTRRRPRQGPTWGYR